MFFLFFTFTKKKEMINDDILTLVFANLDVSSLLVARQVCKSWNKVVTEAVCPIILCPKKQANQAKKLFPRAIVRPIIKLVDVYPTEEEDIIEETRFVTEDDMELVCSPKMPSLILRHYADEGSFSFEDDVRMRKIYTQKIWYGKPNQVIMELCTNHYKCGGGLTINFPNSHSLPSLKILYRK